MKNKTIKTLIIGLTLLPSLVFASEGRFFNFNILPNNLFYFLDRFDEYLERMLTFRLESKQKLEIKLEKERQEEKLEVENKNKIETRLSDDDDKDDDSVIRLDDEDSDEGDEDEDEDREDSKGFIISVPPAPIQPEFTTNSSITLKTYTMAEVSKHNTSASCWSVVSGSVYDLTNWIGNHPGGVSAIKGMCGVDATAEFTGQHGGQARPVSELAGFKIGVLK